MFRKTDPQQNLFKVDANLPESVRRRLQDSWSPMFQKEILPLLMRMEEPFACLYGKTGRPNYSTGRMLGLCLLQELNNLSDQAALDSFCFDVRWQYALDVELYDAYLSRRSLVEFRHRLVAHDPEMKLVRRVFEEVSKAAIRKLQVSVTDQRLDSTHIVSNIHTRSRVDTFGKTLTLFLGSLPKKKYAEVSSDIREWNDKSTESGWFGLGNGEVRTHLDKLARFTHRLLRKFKSDKEVRNTEQYALLKRLFDENCTVKITTKKPPKNRGSKKTSPKTEVKITLKKNTDKGGMQTPHDPDATYGHKGIGYSAQITETCNNAEKPEFITDYEVHGASRSDRGKMTDVLERLESASMQPKSLYADAGYPTEPKTLGLKQKGVELVAPVERGKVPKETMSRADFQLSDDGLVIACPAGHAPVDHRIRSANNSTAKSNYAIFNGNICRNCDLLERCPVRAPNNRPKGCSLRETRGNFRLELTDALVLRDQMFSTQQTEDWKKRYRI